METVVSSDDLSDATTPAERVRWGEVSPSEPLEAPIGRIEELTPRLDAVIASAFERARQAAVAATLPRGGFHGVPSRLGDVGTRAVGKPSHAGMRPWAGCRPSLCA